MLGAGAISDSPFPPLAPHSAFAQPVARLTWIAFGVCGVIFALVCVLIALALARFRACRNPPPTAASQGHRALEIAWTATPLLIVVCLFALSAWTMAVANPSPDRPADVKITAHQWWWEIRYPKSGAITANELHLPAGTRWLVELDSADVIHDFWVPQLAPKMDAVPGHPNFLWIEADAPGTYLGTCAEYCGAQHAWMRIRAIAQEPAEFASWMSRQLAPPPPPTTASAVHGSQLFAQRTCVSCHAVGRNGARFAPDLTHLADRQTIGAGALANTPSDLARWIADAQRYKPGSHMPSLNLSDRDAADVAAYLEGTP